MGALSPSEIATLKTELQKPAYAGLSPTAALAALSAPTVIPNPVPQPQVLKPFVIADVSALLSAASKANVKGCVFVGEVLAAIIAQNRDPQSRDALVHWFTVLFNWGFITGSEATACGNLLTATTPDPAWKATVPGPSVATTLFAGKSWTDTSGTTISTIPVSDVQAAQS